MGHGHGHDWAAGRAEDRRRLRLVLAITLTVLVVEVVGSLLTGSLALLADAGHMLTDSAAVAIALSASHLAALPATDRRTFGYQRAEILAALLNAVVLLGLCGFLVVEGVRRLADPHPVDGGPMLAVAAIGLLANLLSLRLLRPRKEHSLNLRAAYLEVLTDLLGSVAVLGAALAVLLWGLDRADPVATLLVAALVVPRSLLLLRDAVHVLLEATPRHVDVDELRSRLSGIDGVVEVHDLHVWTITSGLPSLSAHVVVEDDCLATRGLGSLLDELCACVADDFDVEHATFQVEPRSHRAHEHLGHDHP